MKKIKKSNLVKNLIIIISLLLVNSSIMLVKELTNLDELWNFNFARCMANGLVPYKDFNMIPMPLITMIASIFLKIFGQEIIVMRMLAVCIITYIEFMIFQISNILKIKDYIKNIMVMLIAIYMSSYIAIDYNYGVLAILLTIIYIEINEYLKNDKILKYNGKIDFLLGVLAGLCITCKQSTGAIIIIVLIGHKILEIREKKQIKEFLKIAITRFGGVIIPVILILLYLLINGAIVDFTDYCISGIKTFSNYIPYTNLLKSKDIIISSLSIIVPIVLVVSLWMYFIKKKKEILIVLAYTIAGMTVIYPIADNIHFLIGVFPSSIIIIILLDKILGKILKKEKIIIFAGYFLRITILLVSIMYFITAILEYKSSNINIQLNHYKYCIMSKEYISKVEKIGQYIKESENEVYILDATACLYMIPIDEYHKDYDLFLIGNLGSKGEEGQIEKINEQSNITILIMNEKYNRNWQTPKQVIKYIQNNLNKVGEIANFDVYQK